MNESLRGYELGFIILIEAVVEGQVKVRSVNGPRRTDHFLFINVQYLCAGWLLDVDELVILLFKEVNLHINCLLYTSPSPRDATLSRMPSSA